MQLVLVLVGWLLGVGRSAAGKKGSIQESSLVAENFAPKDTPDHRQLQDEDEDDEENAEITFQLKMYWEEGYYWQEESFERKWCLECDGPCSSGKLLEIQKCDGSSRQRFIYEEVPGSGGGRLKPKSNPDLCWTRQGTRVHELEPCDLNCKQIILGIQYEGRFEMHPNGRPLDCLEQHHHPRAGEVVRAKDCIESRDDDTSYWVMINKRGGNYTDYKEEKEVLRGSTNITNVGSDVCDGDNPCGLCMGDCDRDRDCQDGLECMRREANETVPGCIGAELEENDGLDVCYDPFGNYTLPPTEAPTTSPAPTVAVPSPPPVELYGDCEFIYPSAAPSPYPTDEPSTSPSGFPTVSPSSSPSAAPTQSAFPTSSPAPSSAPSYEGYCELDETGLFGIEASNTVEVDYAYELVLDPSQDADPDEILRILSQRILQSVLPTLFSDNCTEAPSRRMLQSNLAYDPSGASTSESDSPMDGVNCTGSFPDTNDCIVIDATMLVFTDGNETYDDVVLPVVKDFIDSGALNDAHPAIVNVTYMNETLSEPESETSDTSNGIQNPGLFAILGVFLAAVVVGVIVCWKKKKRQHMTSAEGSQLSDAGGKQGSVSKAMPSSSIVKEQAIAYSHGVGEQGDDDSIIEQDRTFECDSLDDDEFEC